MKKEDFIDDSIQEEFDEVRRILIIRINRIRELLPKIQSKLDTLEQQFLGEYKGKEKVIKGIKYYATLQAGAMTHMLMSTIKEMRNLTNIEFTKNKFIEMIEKLDDWE